MIGVSLDGSECDKVVAEPETVAAKLGKVAVE